MGQEFINPKSMVTPGASGALMMFIVNGLCYSFPELEPRVVALLLSFIIGGVVFKATGLRVGERTAYWVINSLIIFVMGTGAANIASKASGPPERVEAIYHEYNWSILSEAMAQEPENVDEMKRSLEAERVEKERLRMELTSLRAMLHKAESEEKSGSDDKPEARTDSPASTRRFFREW